MSSIRPGTPVYVLTLSRDTGWKYVVSPTVMGWVKSDDVAAADSRFIAEWRRLAQKNLGAFIQAPVSVHDGKRFYFIARPGTILPFGAAWPGYYRTAVPTLGADGKARLRWVTLSASAFTAMPWRMTPQNMATLMKTMGGKPYGWGNYQFYNDCSSEIRSLMLPFGIFLPRNSAAQIQAVSRTVDLSPYSLRSRLDYLTTHGRPFTTLVYIQGHIMLYIGNSLVHGQAVPMTYQNIWGLSPSDRQRRSIIGGAVFFPCCRSIQRIPRWLRWPVSSSSSLALLNSPARSARLPFAVGAPGSAAVWQSRVGTRAASEDGEAPHRPRCPLPIAGYRIGGMIKVSYRSEIVCHDSGLFSGLNHILMHTFLYPMLSM
ncbi:SH3 domain-containing protein [Edwardsiella anguillarum]|nr:SH3 domain-containing protein [Edwardsiella anguillarum]